MLSRGNLGLDVLPEKMALVQKHVIQQCNVLGKPAIVTRVVDTMVTSPRPTRYTLHHLPPQSLHLRLSVPFPPPAPPHTHPHTHPQELRVPVKGCSLLLASLASLSCVPLLAGPCFLSLSGKDVMVTSLTQVQHEWLCDCCLRLLHFVHLLLLFLCPAGRFQLSLIISLPCTVSCLGIRA